MREHALARGRVGRRRYTDDERATYLAMLAAEGYPERPGALKKVCESVGCHPNVLRRWWQGKQNPPPTELVAQKKSEIVDLLDNLIYQTLGLLPDALNSASTRELVTALGVFIDKRQLLTGGPTARSEVSGKDGGAIVVTWSEPVMVDDGDADRADD